MRRFPHKDQQNVARHRPLSRKNKGVHWTPEDGALYKENWLLKAALWNMFSLLMRLPGVHLYFAVDNAVFEFPNLVSAHS
jgi:hypothetical protein